VQVFYSLLILNQFCLRKLRRNLVNNHMKNTQFVTQALKKSKLVNATSCEVTPQFYKNIALKTLLRLFFLTTRNSITKLRLSRTSFATRVSGRPVPALPESLLKYNILMRTESYTCSAQAWVLRQTKRFIQWDGIMTESTILAQEKRKDHFKACASRQVHLHKDLFRSVS